MKKYSETHEWVEVDGSEVLVGISDHAQTLLGDIAFLELPEPGTEVQQGEALGVIESVKSASDFYAPVSGLVVAVNESAAANPSALNGQAEATWLVRLKPSNLIEMESLINKNDYFSAL